MRYEEPRLVCTNLPITHTWRRIRLSERSIIGWAAPQAPCRISIAAFLYKPLPFTLANFFSLNGGEVSGTASTCRCPILALVCKMGNCFLPA